MLDDHHDLTATLTEILVFARSGAPVDELIALFTSRAGTLVGSARVELRPGPRGPDTPPQAAGPGSAPVSRFPVVCGSVPWGELAVRHVGGSVATEDVHRGRLLAEVLGAALAGRGDERVAAAAGGQRTPGAVGADPRASMDVPGPVRTDDLVALVLGCAEDLDRMPEASTRARLALVARRLAHTVGAAAWSVWVRHEDRLYDVAEPPTPRVVGASRRGADALADWVALSRYPARRLATEGMAFYADRYTGDEAERRDLAEGSHTAVVGAGGYDLDGRAWMVDVVGDDGIRLEHATAVLASLVLAALSFPREAVVPRPQEPWVRATLRRSLLPDPQTGMRGFGETG